MRLCGGNTTDHTKNDRQGLPWHELSFQMYHTDEQA